MERHGPSSETHWQHSIRSFDDETEAKASDEAVAEDAEEAEEEEEVELFLPV